MPSLPDPVSEGIDKAITDVVGMHGVWVLAAEVYNKETGEPTLYTVWKNDYTKWAQLGVAKALVLEIEKPLRRDDD